MDEQVTWYELAGVRLKIVSPFPFLSANAEDFRCGAGEADYVFRFVPCRDIPAVLRGSRMVGDVLWGHEYQRPDGAYLRAFLWQERFYDAVTLIGETEGVCYYASAGIFYERARNGFEMVNYLCMERILLNFSALVLHSSHIAVNGRGLVFSAPSQTGKSTQAELWRQYAGAEVVNGDRSILRRRDGVWCVHGCPMCGTSGIHRQGQEPLDHIVMLAQGKENRLERIGGLTAWRLLYPQITIPAFDPDFAGRAMEELEALITEVPVWHYSCTKTPDAVTALREWLGWPKLTGTEQNGGTEQQ